MTDARRREVAARLAALLDDLDSTTRRPGEPPLRYAVAERARELRDARHYRREHPMDCRRFDGQMSSDVELWLGDDFESWLPSLDQLLLSVPEGEQTARAGDLLVRDPDGHVRVYRLAVFVTGR